jgi:hypothetical protein
MRSIVIRLLCACAAVCANTAFAQSKQDEALLFRVELVSSHMQYCTMMDDLMRSTCMRMGHHFTAENRKRFCEMPERPFAARTVRAYESFRRDYREVIDKNQPKLDKLAAKMRRTFENDFARMIGGTASSLDLERLSGELKGTCNEIETVWLAPGGAMRRH